MTTLRRNLCRIGLLGLTACAKEPPPVSVAEFMEDSRVLEATMVRCNQDRSKMKYTANCVNAREAINRLEVREKNARREELEAQSIRKRQALRQTQEAAAEARRRALEEERRKEEAELLGIYEVVVPVGDDEVVAGPPAAGAVPDEQPLQAPSPTDDAPQSDLAAIREELERRQQEPR